MANSLISRVYDITIKGYDESIERLKRITAEFKAMDTAKEALNNKLKEKISGELREYELQCQKCQIIFNENIINEQCNSGGYHEFS